MICFEVAVVQMEILLCACYDRNINSTCNGNKVLVSTSDWQACEDSHWNNRTTFVFHKIVNYNPWTWKQFEDSWTISLPPQGLEFTGVEKLFCYGVILGTKSIVTFRVLCFLRVKRQKVLADDEITGKHENEIKPKRTRRSRSVHSGFV